MTTIAIDAPAPDFTLPSDSGGTVSLSGLKGKKVVLYFYPKDATPGCTTEACDFRDAYLDFTAANAVILGISKDSPASHDKFKAKQTLPFTLVSDEDGAICQAYDVWREKNMYGKKMMGIERSTFLIDEDGVLRREWRKVKVAGHAAALLDAVKAL